jgi:DNA-binding NarL/FixJ family response regulator
MTMLENMADNGNIKLLVVDDHALVTEALFRLLSEEGYEIAIANSGEKALEIAERWHPQVVIMDIFMRGMSGIDATARLRAAYPEIRVLMLSMSADPEIVRRAMEAGAQGYLTKEAGIDALIGAVRQTASGQTVMTPELANALIHESGLAPRFSLRERQVLSLTAAGLTAQQVAQSLGVSTRTVENHLARIRGKTGSRNSAQLTRYALEHNLHKYPEVGPDSK